MAFKLTYSDGQETDYDDDTAWEVDDGVLKMGRRRAEWSVLVSPSHWAVLEVGGGARRTAERPTRRTQDKDTVEKRDEGPMTRTPTRRRRRTATDLRGRRLADRQV